MGIEPRWLVKSGRGPTLEEAMDYGLEHGLSIPGALTELRRKKPTGSAQLQFRTGPFEPWQDVPTVAKEPTT